MTKRPGEPEHISAIGPRYMMTKHHGDGIPRASMPHALAYSDSGRFRICLVYVRRRTDKWQDVAYRRL